MNAKIMEYTANHAVKIQQMVKHNQIQNMIDNLMNKI